MNLESFGAELRKQREQKQLTLEHISEATRINVKFLRAIEDGKFSTLPQAYIRAFIRAYARMIDANPEEVIHRYDETNQEIQVVAEQWVMRGKQEAVAPAEKITPDDIKSPRLPQREVLLLAAVAAVVFIIVYFTTSGLKPGEEKTVTEVPFDKVVQESEAAVVKPETAVTRARPVSGTTTDSLRLEISTSDSVWMTIVIDDVRKGEYLFPPDRKRTWVGKDQFLISMGNAGNATFRLDGKDLGVLGRKGSIIRDVLITEGGIKRPE